MPGLVTNAMLADLRREAASLVCDLPCVLKRFDKPSSQYKQVSPAGLKAGMAAPTAGQLANYEYMLGDAASWHIRFPYGTDVQELDQAVITSPDGTTRQLSIVKVLRPRSYEILVSVLANE